MTSVIKLTFNPFQENTYLIYNDRKDCWIIDPGCSRPAEEQMLAEMIEANGLNPVRLLLTHAHVDHVMGNHFVYKKWGLKPWLHKKDLDMLKNAPTAAAFWSIPFTPGPEPAGFIEEGKDLMLGDETFEVLFTPGHCPGEVCFLHREDRYCIAGDVLFNGSIGRTDLPGGDYDTLIESIRTQLLTLDDDIVIYCGHGPETTIGNERRSNPFLVDG